MQETLPVYALLIPDYGNKMGVHSKQAWVYTQTNKMASAKDVFEAILEDYINDREGECCLPHKPWLFVKGESEEAIKKMTYEIVTTLSTETPEELWNLYKWAGSARCVGFRLKTNY